jgi:hypothetical protein
MSGLTLPHDGTAKGRALPLFDEEPDARIKRKTVEQPRPLHQEKAA